MVRQNISMGRLRLQRNVAQQAGKNSCLLTSEQANERQSNSHDREVPAKTYNDYEDAPSHDETIAITVLSRASILFAGVECGWVAGWSRMSKYNLFLQRANTVLWGMRVSFRVMLYANFTIIEVICSIR